MGGAKWQAGRLLVQERDGTFRPGSEGTLRADSLHEDVDAAFFDANGDVTFVAGPHNVLLGTNPDPCTVLL